MRREDEGKRMDDERRRRVELKVFSAFSLMEGRGGRG
jgi:hypothetical protein